MRGAATATTSSNGRHEQQPLTCLGHPAATEERRQREPEPEEPPDEWDLPEAFTRCGHRSLAQRPVDAREGPKSLADDRDAVRPRHTTETRQGLQAVEAGKHGLHRPTLPGLRPPGNGPGGLRRNDSEAYHLPREKKPSSASTRTMIRMIQRMLSAVTSFRRSFSQTTDLRLGGCVKPRGASLVAERANAKTAALPPPGVFLLTAEGKDKRCQGRSGPARSALGSSTCPCAFTARSPSTSCTSASSTNRTRARSGTRRSASSKTNPSPTTRS